MATQCHACCSKIVLFRKRTVRSATQLLDFAGQALLWIVSASWHSCLRYIAKCCWLWPCVLQPFVSSQDTATILSECCRIVTQDNSSVTLCWKKQWSKSNKQISNEWVTFYSSTALAVKHGFKTILRYFARLPSLTQSVYRRRVVCRKAGDLWSNETQLPRYLEFGICYSFFHAWRVEGERWTEMYGKMVLTEKGLMRC